MKSSRQGKPNRKQKTQCFLRDNPNTTHTLAHKQILIMFIWQSIQAKRKQPFRYDHITQHRCRSWPIDLGNTQNTPSNVWGRKSLQQPASFSSHINQLTGLHKDNNIRAADQLDICSHTKPQASLNFVKVTRLCKGALKGGCWSAFLYLMCPLKCVFCVLSYASRCWQPLQEGVTAV